jgi:hypothetical protein
MQVTNRWDQVLAEMGNKPDLNQGDVIIELVAPAGAMKSVTAASEQLIIGAEAGAVVGLFVHLADGRRLFIPGANIAGIIDAPKEEPTPDKPARQARPRA